MLRISLFFSLIVALLVLPGCRAEATHEKIEPATKEALEDGLYRLTLTEKAIERLDLRTSEISQGQDGQLIMPYSALIYDLYGNTWTYTSPEPRVFVRQAVSVENIEADQVTLSDGPEVGTLVVSLAAAELYGTETGIGK